MHVVPGVLAGVPLAERTTGAQPAADVGGAPARPARTERFPTLVHQASVDATR